MLANTGMVTCYGVPLEFKSTVIGADQPGYRGLVFLSGPGSGDAGVVDAQRGHRAGDRRRGRATGRLRHELQVQGHA